MRVVSLVPSATETLVALGVPPVAGTRFCDLDGVPTVGGTKDPDVAAIVALRPDLVVVNDEENRRGDAEALTAAGVPLHEMSPHGVAGVGSAVRGLAGRLGVAVPPPFGESEWNAWLERSRAPRRAAAFVAVWRRPWMTLAGDTYGSSLLDLLGVGNVYGRGSGRSRYFETSLDEVAGRAPDLVLLPNEPYPFAARHVAEVREGVPRVPVLLVDGRDLFWWGTRTPHAAERLRSVLDAPVH